MVGLRGWGVTDEQGRRKGPWTPEEDELLSDYIGLHGDGRWSSVAKFAGLSRSGKSCRLRWVNYLRPGLKRGHLTPQEEGIIIELHALWGNKWSTIARYLPGRTDNEIKNYWRTTHFKKKAKPCQRQERRKIEAFRQKNYQQQEENYTNKSPSTGEAEMNNEKLVADPQKNQEMFFMYPTMESQSNLAANNYYQDVASWSDSISDDDLWGSLWSLDELVMSSSSMNLSWARCNMQT